MRESVEITLIGDTCCGCGACAASCPKQCIDMVHDEAGFLRPSVSLDLCVSCGVCSRSCPAINVSHRDAPLCSFLAVTRDRDALLVSSSGGAFGALASDVLARGGSVVGASFDEQRRIVRHEIVRSPAGLARLRLSKYIQSSVSREVYQGVKSNLKSGVPVLFCGTACQVSGMRRYLGRAALSTDFLCADVVCHGVPSPKLWNKWVDDLERRYSARLVETNFRSKATGWPSYSVLYEFSNGSTLRNLPGDDWYMQAFINNASLRPSCFSCPSKMSCGSDLTLGDFWGVRRLFPGHKWGAGVSAVVAHTSKGLDALSRVESSLSFRSVKYEDILAGNPALEHSPKPFLRYREFFEDVKSETTVPNLKKRYAFVPTMTSRLISRLGILLSKANVFIGKKW